MRMLWSLQTGANVLPQSMPGDYPHPIITTPPVCELPALTLKTHLLQIIWRPAGTEVASPVFVDAADPTDWV